MKWVMTIALWAAVLYFGWMVFKPTGSTNEAPMWGFAAVFAILIFFFWAHR